MEIIKTNNSNYKNEIIVLYVEAFSSGQSEQYIDLKELNRYIDSILKEGYALLSIEKEKITGAILSCPFNFDKSLPDAIRQNYQIEKSIYLAEMMVCEEFRGQGIGEKLMVEFIKTIDTSKFTDAFIRVWSENIPAMNLYLKMGFEPVATIEQTKMKADKSGTFIMQKKYLHKKLD